MKHEEIANAVVDGEWWGYYVKQFFPEWRLLGFTKRERATITHTKYGSTLELARAHIQAIDAAYDMGFDWAAKNTD